jgi:cell division septal protein FtsQ
MLCPCNETNMTFLSRKPTRPPAARRATRRNLHTAAQTTLHAPPLWGNLWAAQRSKIFAIVLVLALAAVLYVFFETDHFYVFDPGLVGAQYLTPAEIVKASGVRGYSIFFVDTRIVERALMKLPEVRFATVTTRLPNQVTVEIQERQPYIVWQRGGETYWVDGEGVCFRARANLTQLPVLRDLEPGILKPGERVPASTLAAFWALREAMPESPREVEWSAARGIAFTEGHGWKIYLGGANEMPSKIATLRALIAQLGAQNARIRFIDLGKGDPYYQ